MVLSQPDRPAGRGRKLKSSEVKALAQSKGIPVLTPTTLRASRGLEETREALAAMREAKADILVVAAYGLILPQEVLDIPKGILSDRFPGLKAVNIHGSLLPVWRGAAPAARCIEAGDKETGVTIMQMDAGLDTGPMLYSKGFEITDNDTAATVSEKLADLGAEMMVEYLASPEKYPPIAQPEGASYAAKLTKEEGRIDWNSPTSVLARKIRAFNPFPGSFCLRGEDTLKVWFARAVEGSTRALPGTVVDVLRDGIVVACGEGTLIKLEVLQKSGGKRLNAREFLLGYPIKAAEVLA